MSTHLDKTWLHMCRINYFAVDSTPQVVVQQCAPSRIDLWRRQWWLLRHQKSSRRTDEVGGRCRTGPASLELATNQQMFAPRWDSWSRWLPHAPQTRSTQTQTCLFPVRLKNYVRMKTQWHGDAFLVIGNLCGERESLRVSLLLVVWTSYRKNYLAIGELYMMTLMGSHCNWFDIVKNIVTCFRISIIVSIHTYIYT